MDSRMSINGEVVKNPLLKLLVVFLAVILVVTVLSAVVFIISTTLTFVGIFLMGLAVAIPLFIISSLLFGLFKGATK